MMPHKLPPVSIAIPFFNAESTLANAIRSVFAQTHQNWELILIDDGSTDDSLSIARSVDDPRVRTYSDGRNKRLAARLNEVTRLARYDFVARMDADDLMSRDRIERQLRYILNHPEYDLVSCGVVSMSDALVPVGLRCVSPEHRITQRALLTGHSNIVHAAILGRRGWFQRNPYDETMVAAEDTALWAGAHMKGDLRVKILPAPLYFYCEDSSASAEKLRRAYRIMRRHILFNSGGYSVRERLRAYFRSWAQSCAVAVLDKSGRMDMVRARRNDAVVPEQLRRWIRYEIAEICAEPVPFHPVTQIEHASAFAGLSANAVPRANGKSNFNRERYSR